MGIITKPEFYFINDELDCINNALDNLEPWNLEAYNECMERLDKISKRVKESQRARIKQSGLKIVK